MVKVTLTAKCGKTGFKTPQGLAGHERMCDKCKALSNDKKNEHSSAHNSSTQKPATQRKHQHHYRPLTEKEKDLKSMVTGKRMGDLYELICDDGQGGGCGDLK